MRDTVRYALPLGPLGEIAHRLFVARDLERIFTYRRDYLTVSVASMPRLTVIADRAEDRVLAGGQIDRERRRVLTRHGLGRLLDAVALDLGGVRDLGLVGELDRDLAGRRPCTRSR